jgi:hypothetical protein
LRLARVRQQAMFQRSLDRCPRCVPLVVWRTQHTPVERGEIANL